jgi:two-component system CheB/CheR fusion protein
MAVSVPTEPVYVQVDPIRMEQVFGNLLNNASKFTPRWGHIWVTLEVTSEEGRSAPDAVTIGVRDAGIGIDLELLPQVFDLFTQGEHSLARSQGGLGIGLSIVRRLVELHGGRVEARSGGRDQGSEFLVRLPLAHHGEPGEIRDTVTPRIPEPEITRRVLVVDDSHDAADTLALLLRVNGHEIRVAFDAQSALEAAATFVPEVVLLDIGLPIMSGYEVAKEMRQLPGMAQAFLVALTGYGQERDRSLSRQAGFDQHLTKPVDHQALLRLLRSPAGGR